MTDLTSFQVTDGVTDVLAAQYNLLLGSILTAQIYNSTTMSGTVQLADTDTALQQFLCNGANRIVKLPAYSVNNHPFVILNKTANTYTLDVQTSAGVSLLTTLLPALTGYAMLVPDGSAGYVLVATNPVTALNPSQGFLTNGKIVPSVASNNLTVAIKTLAGADPSVGDPVKIRIGDTIRTITAALSVTKNAATNWFNSGGLELKTLEIDYFVYLGYNATDGVVIGFARIPGARQYSDFSVTTTNENYCAISTITTAASTDYYEVIGRFAATLSGTAAFNWSVPTFTAINLIQSPIYETRWLVWTPAWTGQSSMTIGTITNPIAKYRIQLKRLEYNIVLTAYTIGGTPSAGILNTLPFESADVASTPLGGALLWTDAGGSGFGGSRLNASTPDQLFTLKYNAANWAAGAGTLLAINGFYLI